MGWPFASTDESVASLTWEGADAAVERVSPLITSPHCGYYNFTTMLNTASLWEHLHPSIPRECEPRSLMAAPDSAVFDGFTWAEWTSHNWHIPIVTSVLYLILVPSLMAWMKNRKPIRLQSVVLVWNFGLSAFSLAGVVACAPRLLAGQHGLFTDGFIPSICTNASFYGAGWSGFFVAAFIYSKLFELVDTLWLVLRKAPVIFLHWYHHVTVLLYCWHSYSARIGTGVWFATMNYTVHSIMYCYFGLTQLGPKGKKLAKKFSMFITTLQLLQMVGGIVVTVTSMVQHANGERCFVSLANSFLGLAMYASYFVLFLQLFLSHYVFNKKPHAAANATMMARPAEKKEK